MPWAASEGRQKFHALDNLPSQIQQKGFQTADLLYAFVKTDVSQIDPDTRSSADLDLKTELLNGRAKVLTKTDCLERYCKEASKRTSYFYNSRPVAVSRKL